MSDFIQEIQSEYGNSINAADVKAFARSKGVNYRTVTRQLDNFKVKRGTWDLTVVERLKKTCLLYTSPSPRDYAASRMPSSA